VELDSNATETEETQPRIAIIGGGPAGLMAAQTLGAGVIFDSKPTVGRKFLLAGRGGLNLTHSEPLEDFITRYDSRSAQLAPLLREFGPTEVVEWCKELGFETFVGSSRRVFPRSMKAAPLLRAWLRRIGVEVRSRHHWIGWDEHGHLLFETPSGPVSFQADATVLALGGASWPKMGSTGKWVPLLREKGVEIRDLTPSNVGYEVDWTRHFVDKFAGHPLKSVALTYGGQTIEGELMVTSYGLEGSLIYPFSPLLRPALPCTVLLDLVPGTSQAKLEASLARDRGSRSLSKFLRQRAGIVGVKMGLVNEFLRGNVTAATLKALPIHLQRARPIEEAISSAGGVTFECLDQNFMVRKLPGVFCTGEMLDWEAPTGGYLLTACFATGRAAGLGVQRYLAR
jgi:uncharacterized flavoprotein (TIGR03862 family)